MPKTKYLTSRQLAVFNFVRQRVENGMPPTFKEIGEHIGFSPVRAGQILHVLQKKGYIDFEERKPRTITLLPPYKDDTRHSFVAKKDVPELDIQKGDSLLIDTAKPIAEGDVILSTQGEVKRFCVGDVAFAKVLGFTRPIEAHTCLDVETRISVVVGPDEGTQPSEIQMIWHVPGAPHASRLIFKEPDQLGALIEQMIAHRNFVFPDADPIDPNVQLETEE